MGLVSDCMNSAAPTDYVNSYVARNKAVFAMMREKQKKK